MIGSINIDPVTKEVTYGRCVMSATALIRVDGGFVGVIANLAIWFALHTLFAEVQLRHLLGMTLQAPVLKTLNFPALALSIAAIIALFRFKLGMIGTLLGASLAGVLMYLAGWVG